MDALLRANGYRTALGQVFLDWPNLVPPSPVSTPAGLDVELKLEWRRHQTQRPGLAIAAWRGEKELGGRFQAILNMSYPPQQHTHFGLLLAGVDMQPDPSRGAIQSYLLVAQAHGTGVRFLLGVGIAGLLALVLLALGASITQFIRSLLGALLQYNTYISMLASMPAIAGISDSIPLSRLLGCRILNNAMAKALC